MQPILLVLLTSLLYAVLHDGSCSICITHCDQSPSQLVLNYQSLQVEKRYNYTTPKTFLELIKLYKSVLARKRNQVQEAIDRLDTVSMSPSSYRTKCSWKLALAQHTGFCACELGYDELR